MTKTYGHSLACAHRRKTKADLAGKEQGISVGKFEDMRLAIGFHQIRRVGQMTQNVWVH